MKRALPIGVVLAAWTASAVAQPRAAATSPREARDQFGVIVRAAQELSAVMAAGRNVRGGLQSWDRRWRFRLRGLGRAVVPAGASCEAREVAALIDGAAAAVWSARAFVFAQEEGSLVPLARELAARRTLADEASGRRAAGASCTDLPDLSRTERSLRETTAIAALLDIARRGRAPTP